MPVKEENENKNGSHGDIELPKQQQVRGKKVFENVHGGNQHNLQEKAKARSNAGQNPNSHEDF